MPYDPALLGLSSVNWNSRMFAIRGLLAIVLGVVALMLPAAALMALVIAFGAYAFVDGFFALISLASRHRRISRLWLLLEGLAGLVAGSVAFFAPEPTAVALVYVIAIWALVTGFFKIAEAIRLRRELRGEGLIMLSGAASILLAVILMAFPIAGTLAVVWVLGAYGILFGAALLAMAFRFRESERASPDEERRAA